MSAFNFIAHILQYCTQSLHVMRFHFIGFLAHRVPAETVTHIFSLNQCFLSRIIFSSNVPQHFETLSELRFIKFFSHACIPIRPENSSDQHCPFSISHNLSENPFTPHALIPKFSIISHSTTDAHHICNVQNRNVTIIISMHIIFT